MWALSGMEGMVFHAGIECGLSGGEEEKPWVSLRPTPLQWLAQGLLHSRLAMRLGAAVRLLISVSDTTG